MPRARRDSTSVEYKHVRAAVGVLFALGNVALVVIHAVNQHAFTQEDIIIHATFLIAALMLIGWNVLKELLETLKEYVPFIKSRGS
jgi:hypothetical protein